MKNNGFSLIELLVVIVILGVLVSIALPKIISSRDAALLKTYEIAVNNIEKAANTYVIENMGEFSSGTTFEIQLQDLCDDRYIECPVYNPNTEEVMNGHITVTKQGNGSFIYEYHEAE